MKIIYSAILIVLIFSCKGGREENLQKMEGEFRTVISDEAFKNNQEIKILELKAVSYDTVSETDIDLRRIGINQYDLEHNKEMLKLTEPVINSQKKLVELDPSNYLYQENLKNQIEKARGYESLIDHYEDIDSSLRQKINNRKNPADIYECKFYLKAVYTKDGKSSNVMDTLYNFFTKEIKPINLE